MSTYVVPRRSTSLGQQAKGEVDAESKQSVADQLKAKGLIVLDIAEKGRASQGASSSRSSTASSSATWRS